MFLYFTQFQPVLQGLGGSSGSGFQEWGENRGFGNHRLKIFYFMETIFYKGIMPSEKVLDLPVDCNTLTGSVNL